VPLRGDPNEYETKDWSFYSARSDSSKARNTNETKRQHDTDLGRGGNCPRTKFFLCHASSDALRVHVSVYANKWVQRKWSVPG